MTKLSLYLATLLLGSNFSASTTPAAPPRAIHQSVRMTANEYRYLELSNHERVTRGLGTLSPNPMLVQVARQHSREMWERDYFDHVSPTPGMKTPMSRYLTTLGRTPTWAYLGENLFYCSIVDVDRGHRAFMTSQSHRENVLNDRFEQMGVGIFVSPDGRYWVTELFLAQVD